MGRRARFCKLAPKGGAGQFFRREINIKTSPALNFSGVAHAHKYGYRKKAGLKHLNPPPLHATWFANLQTMALCEQEFR